MTKKNTELESGKIKINEDVYATIATMAALETKGIHHMSSTFNDGVNTFFAIGLSSAFLIRCNYFQLSLTSPRRCSISSW